MQPREFFQSVSDAFARASQRVETSRDDLMLARHPVTIHYATPILAKRLSPALMHSRYPEPHETPSLRIHVWDTTASATPPPPPPWGPHDYREKGRIRGFNQDGIHTAYRIGENVLYMFDEHSGDAFFWTPDAASLPEYQTGSPFLTIIQWWAEHHGLTLMHAGAIGSNAGGLLITGPGGSGKSTTCMACALSDGFQYLSDDYCLFDHTTDRALSLYSTGKLDSHSLSILPAYERFLDEPSRRADGKAVIYFGEHLTDRLIYEQPVCAILLPNTAGLDRARIREASAGQSLKALAPSTIFQLTGADRHSFEAMASLCRRLPSFHLDLSHHMEDVPDIIRGLIKRLN